MSNNRTEEPKVAQFRIKGVVEKLEIIIPSEVWYKGITPGVWKCFTLTLISIHQEMALSYSPELFAPVRKFQSLESLVEGSWSLLYKHTTYCPQITLFSFLILLLPSFQHFHVLGFRMTTVTFLLILQLPLFRFEPTELLLLNKMFSPNFCPQEDHTLV